VLNQHNEFFLNNVIDHVLLIERSSNVKTILSSIYGCCIVKS